MAIKLIANYSKRLGLPGYSSHQFSVQLESELSAADDIPKETARIYELLQSNVDDQIRSTGFVPPADYGMEDSQNSGQPVQQGRDYPLSWKCSEKQRCLIENLVAEHQLEKAAVEALARQRFGKGVRLLNKREASKLIDELIASNGHSPPRTSNSRFERVERRAA